MRCLIVVSSFESIRQAILVDPTNAGLHAKQYAPLYTASAESKIVIIGQAPGRRAQETMRPWNDVSGVRLRSWLGVSSEQFYDPDRFALMPMDFFYPGKGKSGDLPPRPDFAPTWHPLLLALMPEVRLTILVGSYAQKHYLGTKAKPTLTQTVRAYEEYGPAYFPLVHSSPLNFRWHARNPWFESNVVPRLRQRVHEVLDPAT
jgi:uracil-DNA glycosylase